MIKIEPNSKKNCINIMDDIYILEKESCYRQRKETTFMNPITKETIPAHAYSCFYETVFKSVNMGNVIVYRIEFLNEIKNVSFTQIANCIESIAKGDMSDFFVQPNHTIYIIEADECHTAVVQEYFDKVPNLNSIDDFIENESANLVDTIIPSDC